MYDVMTLTDLVDGAVLAGDFWQARELIRDAGFIPNTCTELLEKVLEAESAYRRLEGRVVFELLTESAASARHLIETSRVPAAHKSFLQSRVLGYEQGPTYFASKWPAAYIADGERVSAHDPWTE